MDDVRICGCADVRIIPSGHESASLSWRIWWRDFDVSIYRPLNIKTECINQHVEERPSGGAICVAVGGSPRINVLYVISPVDDCDWNTDLCTPAGGWDVFLSNDWYYYGICQ